MTPHAHYALLIMASLAAGAINAVASGGSFLSFPAMLGMGVLPVQANATNTVAIWPGQLTSVLKLREDLPRHLLRVSLVCSVFGGVTGALILLHTPQNIFLHVLPWMILTGTLIFLFSGKLSRWLSKKTQNPQEQGSISQTAIAAMLVPVCIYIGYFGAGGGMMVMAALAVLGMDNMHELNVMKILVACLSNLSAVLTFIATGAVVWRYCFIAMVAAGLGGWVGAHYARRMPQAVLRTVVIAVGFTISGYFFYRNLHPAH